MSDAHLMCPGQTVRREQSWTKTGLRMENSLYKVRTITGAIPARAHTNRRVKMTNSQKRRITEKRAQPPAPIHAT